MGKEDFELVSFAGKLLLRVAEEINRERLLKVASALQKEGITLFQMSSVKILEYLYGIDFVVKAEDVEGEVIIGVEITPDYTSVDRKIKSLSNPKMKSMLKAIGIDFVLVVVWEQETTYLEMTKEEQYQLSFSILKQVNTVISRKWVKELIIL